MLYEVWAFYEFVFEAFEKLLQIPSHHRFIDHWLNALRKGRYPLDYVYVSFYGVCVRECMRARVHTHACVYRPVNKILSKEFRT